MYNAHVYAFWNSPLHLRKAWTKLQIAKVEHEINHGDTNRSADTYYNLKDESRRLRAGLAQTTELKLDPMGFWFGRQSN